MSSSSGKDILFILIADSLDFLAARHFVLVRKFEVVYTGFCTSCPNRAGPQTLAGDKIRDSALCRKYENEPQRLKPENQIYYTYVYRIPQ
jgi:hypothetical protein